MEIIFTAFQMEPLLVHGNAFLISCVYSFGLNFEVWIEMLFSLFVTEISPMIIYIISSNCIPIVTLLHICSRQVICVE